MDEGERVRIAGKALACPHCRGVLFVEREALLNTAGMTFLGLDWLNEGASAFVCVACGRIEMFLGAESEVETVAGEVIECLECGRLIPEAASSCGFCGWSFVPSGDVTA